MTQPSGPKSAVCCRGLVKRYGKVVAVAGLDLEVRGGECFGMLGPNGAGKTTSVEIFEGLRVPDAGEVEVLGEPWRGDGLTLRARLGIQLQETKFPDKLRVSEVVTLFRSFYPHGLEVVNVLALVGLEEKAGAYVRTLSGGQKQRLSLGCALVGPTSSRAFFPRPRRDRRSSAVVWSSLAVARWCLPTASASPAAQLPSGACPLLTGNRHHCGVTRRRPARAWPYRQAALP